MRPQRPETDQERAYRREQASGPSAVLSFGLAAIAAVALWRTGITEPIVLLLPAAVLGWFALTLAGFGAEPRWESPFDEETEELMRQYTAERIAATKRRINAAFARLDEDEDPGPPPMAP